MKKGSAKLKEKYEYVSHAKLTLNEAAKVLEMEGNGLRKEDVAFTYLAIKTIKGLIDKGYDINAISPIFLNKISNLTIDQATDLINIMFFKEDLGLNDCYMAIRTFYDFFEEENIDYQDERLNTIHDYITTTSDDILDDSLLIMTYKTILIVDINLLAKNDDNKFFDYLSRVDYQMLQKFFDDNRISYDPSFNKNLFKLQLSYIKEYLHEKVKIK